MRGQSFKATLPEITARVIARVSEIGFENATIEELAAAVELSRSTFFRRFGSKEDVIFADHEYLLEQLRQLIETTTEPAQATLQTAINFVLNYHLNRAEITRNRYQIIQQHQELRDRELVFSHRYERLFREYLRQTVLTLPEQKWQATALAAATVAVHNEVLRQWLHQTITGDIQEILGLRFNNLFAMLTMLPGGAPQSSKTSKRELLAQLAKIIPDD